MGVRSVVREKRWVVQSASALTLLCVAGVAWIASTHEGAITEHELRTHVRYLASEKLAGRLPGTSGYDSAAQYAARAFRQSGLAPGQRDSGSVSYQQSLPMVRTRVAPESRLMLHSGKTTEFLPHGERSFLVISARPGRTVIPESSPIFAGYGIHAPQYGVDDIAGLDLAGRPVLLNLSVPDSAELARMPPPLAALYARTKAAQHQRLDNLVNRGAAAILLVPNRWLIGDWDEMAARWQRVAYTAESAALDSTAYSKIPIAVLHADLVDRMFMGRKYHPISHAGTYQTFEFSDLTMRIALDVRAVRFASANVIGVVRGSDSKLRGEYVMVSARLDGPGVSRNGTSPDVAFAAACATLLEIADAAAHQPPRRSVLFVLFTADVGGRYGVLHFAAHPPVNPKNIVASIELGELGAGDEPLTGYADRSFQQATHPVAAQWRGKLALTPAIGAPAFEHAAAAIMSHAGVPSLLITERPDQQDGPNYNPQLLLAETRDLHAIVISIANARNLAKPQRHGMRRE